MLIQSFCCCCFILPVSCRGVVVCFSFSFCTTGISVKSVLLFSGIFVWPWQSLEIELSHQAAARTTGNVLLNTSTALLPNPLRSLHRRRKKSRNKAKRSSIFIYTSICIWTVLSPVTWHNGFQMFRLWATTQEEIVSTPNTLTFPTFVVVPLWRLGMNRRHFITHVGRALNCYIQRLFAQP